MLTFQFQVFYIVFFCFFSSKNQHFSTIKMHSGTHIRKTRRLISPPVHTRQLALLLKFRCYVIQAHVYAYYERARVSKLTSARVKELWQHRCVKSVASKAKNQCTVHTAVFLIHKIYVKSRKNVKNSHFWGYEIV